ncbi:MAG: chemotaxis response regulator protein-glutamate methylesterase [Limnochordia bacterium]|nr:chemotaxis response regulator protein-glutamate methylesterase [Limnochordia bacterium]MDD4516937.1 chemotaxis response regulator protein-glutamate methylesterase [Limnochordia bacterium]
MSTKVRVMVVDDSAFMRRLISDLLEKDPDLEVVSTAANGLEFLDKVRQVKVDVVTLDVHMPGMDGITALGEMMKTRPIPVVLLSSVTKEGSDITTEGLLLGAVDFLTKPIAWDNIEQFRDQLILKVKTAATANMTGLVGGLPTKPLPSVRACADGAARLIAIGSSTGGPRALEILLAGLAPDLPAGIIISQHMPGQFTASLAQRLNDTCPLEVREAKTGDTLNQGLALLTPGDYHMRVTNRCSVELTTEEKDTHIRPSIDVMISSAAQVYGPQMVAVILTGMGRDGAAGCVQAKRAGGLVVAQDEATSVVYGMPKAVKENGTAHLSLPINGIAEFLNWYIKGLEKGDSPKLNRLPYLTER